MDGGGLARGGIYWKKKKGKRVRERLRNLFEVLGTITVKKKKKKKIAPSGKKAGERTAFISE